MNNVNTYGDTPLMIAAYNHHAEGIRILLEKGADVNYPNESCYNIALMYVRNVPSVELLLEAGADVNKENLKGETPLISAMYGMIDIRCIDLYIAAGADVNSKIYDGETTLHKAAFHGSFKNMNLLLKAGADVNAQDEHYNTPLIMAVALDCDNFFTESLMLESCRYFWLQEKGNLAPERI